MRRLCLPVAIRNWTLRVQVKLIKIGALLVRHARRPVFQLAEGVALKEVSPGALGHIGRLRAVPGCYLCSMSEGIRSDRGEGARLEEFGGSANGVNAASVARQTP